MDRTTGAIGRILGLGLLVSGCIPNMEPPMRAAEPVAPPPAQVATVPPQAAPVTRPVPVSPAPRPNGSRPAIRRSVPAAAPRTTQRVPMAPPVSQRPAPVATPTAPVSSLPAPRPSWELRPVTPDAREIADSVYVVKPGDTLRAVADRTGAGSEVIARANALPPPFMIRTGQRLTIPGGRYHLVRSGESGIAIARAYGVSWSRIVDANALSEPYVLRAGQRILIPGTAPGATPLSSAAERAAAFKLDVDDILTGGEPALASNQEPAKPSATPRRVLPPTAVVAAPARLRSGFAWPVDGRVVKRFGAGSSGERNDGIKIAAPVGTPIKATADGVVAYVGDGIAALGGLVIVKHGDGWTSVYGHASKLMVQRGQSVKRGQTLALSGQTGFADRPELHFELRRGRTPVDPLSQLPKP
ncbi:peptidoglycan DD-metalloendopeptidase family protein [Sphingomonas sanguinis]|uniref:Peptidoglycan DD-metalloendopeptidase family protein n=1 Tax=Sphingomonas sanguinis TaxID=33051 RepID=A0ABU5LNX5_9SPHN|nr:peptidoglycan DD-metalloendopeptidase family protein [Sphingomonas sanguinis]MDZ7281644.1 peptidoglycan DD-metalloendopeptidase family protein [Sphingomonas sanguinis]